MAGIVLEDEEEQEWTAHVDMYEHSTPGKSSSVAADDVHAKASEGNSGASDGKALKITIYGAVNAMMAIPILYGYAAIIFRWIT